MQPALPTFSPKTLVLMTPARICMTHLYSSALVLSKTLLQAIWAQVVHVIGVAPLIEEATYLRACTHECTQK